MEVTGHAATGAAGGAMLGLVPGFITNNIALGVVIVGCAGMALLPDMDHPKATAAQTFGPFSRGLAHLIEKLSAWVYIATRKGRDARRQGGHRTLTHTFLFCVAAGIGTLLAATSSIAALVILFVALCLGIRGFFPKTMRNAKSRLFPKFLTKIFPKTSAKVFLYLVASMVPLIMYAGSLPMLTNVQLALMVAWGAAIHNLGDCLTNSGAPLLYPLPIQRQLWYRFKFPARFNTGSDEGKFIEKIIKRLCFVFILTVFFLRWYVNR
jgi:membrane-bound metal-dependent hydrolase YbcI (DUF457 family)